MSDNFCPRQISFLLPGNPGVRVTATEDGSGGILFTVDVQDTTGSTGDLRAVFFDIDPAAMAGLIVSDGGPLLTEYRVSSNNVLDLGDGATLAGKVKAKFDVGLEWGTPGGKKDDINFEVGFTLTNAAGNLTLDDLAGLRFGAKLDSVGGPGGVRNATTKLLLAEMPAAPDAMDDVEEIFEDGADGLDDPSKDPQGVTLNLLDNDTDADTAHADLRITSIHEADEVGGPMHGTVEISADGRSVIYTPDADYSGTDSFLYCISDGNGGQDNALCTVTIVAVADDPIIDIQVAQGSHINETLVTVTATQNDADGSEYLHDIDWLVGGGGAPAGVTITPLSVVPGGVPGQIIQMFTVTTTAETDWNFDIDFTATAVETSNLDTEDATGTQNIEIDYTNNSDTLTYTVDDQSIWSNGDAFVFDYDQFHGIDDSWGDSGGDPDVLGTSYDVGVSLKAGFDIDVHFEAGSIDATIPIDATINTTYNKTTDVIYIESILALGSGGSFLTTGPEGHFLLDFIFEVEAHAFAEIAHFTIINESFNKSLSQNIFDFDSMDPPPDPYSLLGGIVEVGLAWPHISVANDAGLMSGSGASNNFLSATLDIDQLANYLLGGALSFIDTEPTNPDNFELLDLDITGGLNFLQEFAIGLAETTANLVLEDGTVIPITWGTPITISNASSHELADDGDDILSFYLDLTPNVTLTNDTDLGLNLSAHLTILKNFELGSIVDQDFAIASGSIDVFNDTFALSGVGSQSFEFFA